jgi:hypothetical protein
MNELDNLFEAIKKCDAKIPDPKKMICSLEQAAEVRRIYPKCKIFVSDDEGNLIEYVDK